MVKRAERIEFGFLVNGVRSRSVPFRQQEAQLAGDIAPVIVSQWFMVCRCEGRELRQAAASAAARTNELVPCTCGMRRSNGSETSEHFASDLFPKAALVSALSTEPVAGGQCDRHEPGEERNEPCLLE